MGDDNIYYENDLFAVIPALFTDPVLNETVEAYGVLNKATGIREAEARRFFTARTLADGFEDQHKNPEKYLSPSSAQAVNDGPRMH
jgi:hypothetical protein